MAEYKNRSALEIHADLQSQKERSKVRVSHCRALHRLYHGELTYEISCQDCALWHDLIVLAVNRMVLN